MLISLLSPTSRAWSTSSFNTFTPSSHHSSALVGCAGHPMVATGTSVLVSPKSKHLRQARASTPATTSRASIASTKMAQGDDDGDMTDNLSNVPSGLDAPIRTLAGRYVVELETITNAAGDYATQMLLCPIADVVDPAEVPAEGARSFQALHTSMDTVREKATTRLQCTMVMADQEQTKNDVASAWEIRVQAENVQSSMDGHANDAGDEQQQEQLLLSTLSRVLVQWALRDATSAASGGCADVNVSFSGGLTDCVQNDNETLVLQQSNELSDKEYETLFAFLLVDATKGYGEWVEMVPWTGRVLGRLPRSLVHTINVLHRGIGMFVTKDVAMIRQHGHEHGGDAEEDDAGIRDASHHQDDALSQYSYPDLYVHRRTDSKRIFPSLYDMFIGGVSLAGKASEATARREVAEELGLVQALHCNDAGSDALSEPLLDCVVCTSHNRCFVTLYSYAMDMSVESVTWQEEEVAWGAFMPYPIIVASADLSIQRLAERMQWPGGYPPIQSSMKGSLPTAFQDVTEAGRSNHAFEDPHDDVNINTNVNANVDAADGVIEVAAEEDGEDAQAASGWGSWDYVPDGLLVWEAWLKSLQIPHECPHHSS